MWTHSVHTRTHAQLFLLAVALHSPHTHREERWMSICECASRYEKFRQKEKWPRLLGTISIFFFFPLKTTVLYASRAIFLIQVN